MKLLIFRCNLNTFVKCYVFGSNVSSLTSLIYLYEITKFEDSRGSNKLTRINIIDVLDMRYFFAQVSAF